MKEELLNYLPHIVAGASSAGAFVGSLVNAIFARARLRKLIREEMAPHVRRIDALESAQRVPHVVKVHRHGKEG